MDSKFNSFSVRFNSIKRSIRNFGTQFNSIKYSTRKVRTKFNSQNYSIQFFFKKIQFKILFKMLKLAEFNSKIYSFNKKMWVSITLTVSLFVSAQAKSFRCFQGSFAQSFCFFSLLLQSAPLLSHTLATLPCAKQTKVSLTSPVKLKSSKISDFRDPAAG